MKKTLLLSALGVSLAFSMKAQDINFSQFHELPLLRNPGLAGIYKGDFRATSAYRSQWGSVTTPFTTMALGTEMKFGLGENSNDYLSLGFQITHDQAGDSRMSKTQVMPMLTFHKSVNGDKDSYLSLGVMGGAAQQRFDPSGLRFSDQFVGGSYSPTNPTNQNFNNTQLIYWDATVGLSYSSVMGNDIKYYLGAAYFHVNQPKVAYNNSNDIQLNRKLVLNLGLSAPTSEYGRLIFYTDLFTQGGYEQFQGGLLYKHDLVQTYEEDAVSLSVGSFFRWNDAVIPVVKLDYYNVGLGMSYDINTSDLQIASLIRGGFELTLSYRNFLNIRNSSAERVRCPVAF